MPPFEDGRKTLFIDCSANPKPLLTPYSAEEMESWRVGDAAKNWRNDYAELIKPQQALF